MLKNILSLLLSKFYSKKESGEVAKQSYPSTAATSIQLTPSDGVTNKEMSYTPPSDGYLLLRDQGLPQSSSYLITRQYAEGVGRGDKILFDLLIMIPVFKGVPVTIRYCGTGAFAQFIGNIGVGGGDLKNALLQGGALCCLKHSFSSLRKSSLQAKRNGSDIKPCRAIAYNSTTRSLCTLHRVMDGLVFTEIQLRTWILLFCPAARLLQDLQLHKAIVTTEQASLFQSQRGRNFRLFLLQVSQKFGSHQLTDPQINLAEGGASC